jgi:predicted transcriptional regulator
MTPTTHRVSDEHAELLGLALNDIQSSIDQLIEAGILDKRKRLYVVTMFEDILRTETGNPMSRAEIEAYENPAF